MEKPKQIQNVDLDNLRKICQSYIDDISDPEIHQEDNDNEHYIFETAMETIFGKGVWKYINHNIH